MSGAPFHDRLGSLWEKGALTDPSSPPLKGELNTDVCIVGAGFSGLSAALRLSEKGIAVVVLDAFGPGFGASGRNGGQVLPGLKWSPDELVERYGKDRGERIAAFSGAAPELVYDIIRRHGIACGLRRCGWLNAAVDDAAFAIQMSKGEQWSRRGAPVRAIERAETARMLGTGRYRGALLDQRAGALNPLSYARGIASAAMKFGATVYRGTKATELLRSGDKWIAKSEHGAVRAGQVILATNAYTEDLWPGLAQEVIPIHSLQVATEPLPPDLRAGILPGGHVVSDTQRILLYFRLDDEGRFVMGGRGSLGKTNRDSLYRFVEDAACRLFPSIGKPKWAYRWSGKVALTIDHMPRIHELAPGLKTVLGYNGRGVAMATAMGTALADWVVSGDADAVPLPASTMSPLPFHRFRRPVLEVVTSWYRLRDRMSWRRGANKGA